VDCCRTNRYDIFSTLIQLEIGHTCSYYAVPPHCNDVDDIYNGYLIPKGSIIIMNLWSVFLCLPGMPVDQLILCCQEHDS
jgi:hypothetical protein